MYIIYSFMGDNCDGADLLARVLIDIILFVRKVTCLMLALVVFVRLAIKLTSARLLQLCIRLFICFIPI